MSIDRGPSLHPAWCVRVDAHSDWQCATAPTLLDIRAKRAAQHQYVQAAERFREMARDERKAGRETEALEEIADALMDEARYEAAE